MSQRSRVGVLAVLLAVAGIAAALGVVTATDVLQNDTEQAGFIQVTNSTNYLSPPAENVTQEGYTTVGIDVAGAVATDTERLKGEQRIKVFELQTAEDIDSREVAREEIANLEAAVARLDTQQQQLYARYSAGEITEQTLLRQLAQLEVAADEYRRLAQQIQSEANVPQGTELSTRYSNLNASTPLLPRPIDDRIDRTISGAAEPATLYIQSAEDSLVLASVFDNNYVRQATVRRHRQPSVNDQFVENSSPGVRVAFNRAEFLYPWTGEDVLNPNTVGFGNSSVYRFLANHSHGVLQTYLDGGTRNVFHELQQKDPIAVPVKSTRTATSQTMRLTVQSTGPTGPMLLTLVGTGTEAPDSVTVMINGDAIGTLEVGEELWTVQPLGSYEITATAPSNETVSVTGP